PRANGAQLRRPAIPTPPTALMVTAVVAAAGRGTRFGAAENKVFAVLAGRSLLYWTLSALQRSPSISAAVVATGSDARERVRATIAEGSFGKVVAICEGGAERHETVWKALQAVPPETELVAVHDAARPLASPRPI